MLRFKPDDPNGAPTGTPPADPPAPPAGDPPAGDPPAGDPPAGDPPAGDPPAGDPPAGDPPAPGVVQMTQAELDAMIADRVRRAEASAAKKAQEEAQAAAERAQMTEVERLKAEKADAEKVAQDALAQANTVLVKAAATTAALAAGVNPARVDMVLRLAELSGVEIKDGAPDAAGIEAAIAAVKTSAPELFGVQTPGRSGGDFGTTGQPQAFTAAQIAAMSVEEFDKNREAIMAAAARGAITR